MTQGVLPPFVLLLCGYLLVLVAAAILVNVLLNRLTKRERSDRRRHRRGAS